MNLPKDRQVTFNTSSRDQWDAFAPHRQRVSRLLGAGAPYQPDRLCVLGVGNALDLDLPSLLEAHREVHLVDLDGEALRLGLERQHVADHPGVRLFGGVDVTSMLETIATWSPTSVLGSADLAALAERPARLVPPALPCRYELVASTCLLRPLIGNAYHSVGPEHPHFPALVRAIRVGHLRLLARLLAPGGRGILITDVVSSQTLPELESLPGSSLSELLRRIDREGNFFHGVGPTDLASTFRRDPILNEQTVDRQSLDPWRWNLHGRVYLVWTLTFRTPAFLAGQPAPDRPA